MKKVLLFAIILMTVSTAWSQHLSFSGDGVNITIRRFFMNVNRVVQREYLDTLVTSYWPKHQFFTYDSNRNEPSPVSILWTDELGFLKRSSISSLNTIITPDSSLYATRSWVNNRGFLTSYNETDPLFSSSSAFGITNSDISNWNTSFGWGNHSVQGYLKGTDTLFLSNRINNKFNIPSGNSNQYIRGDGSLSTLPTQVNCDWNATSGIQQILNKPNLSSVATSGNYNDLSNKPAIKRTETYSGTTNASGTYTVVFTDAYTNVPSVQASISNQSNVNQSIRVSNVSTTGFTVHVYQRNSVTLLGVEVLLSTIVNSNAINVDVLVIEK